MWLLKFNELREMPKICSIPSTKYRKVRLSVTAMCVCVYVFGRRVAGVILEVATRQVVKVHRAIPCIHMAVQRRHSSTWIKLFARV